MSVMDILELGRQGLSVYREAINTASKNIANVNMSNYSRQRVELVSCPTGLRGGRRMGGGVTVNQVIRIYDKFVQKQIFDESKHLGEL